MSKTFTGSPSSVQLHFSFLIFRQASCAVVDDDDVELNRLCVCGGLQGSGMLNLTGAGWANEIVRSRKRLGLMGWDYLLLGRNLLRGNCSGNYHFVWTRVGGSRRRRKRSSSPAVSVASRPPKRWCAAATSAASRPNRKSCPKRADVAIPAPRSATAPSPPWRSKPRPLSTTPALKQVQIISLTLNWINWADGTRGWGRGYDPISQIKSSTCSQLKYLYLLARKEVAPRHPQEKTVTSVCVCVIRPPFFTGGWVGGRRLCLRSWREEEGAASAAQLGREALAPQRVVSNRPWVRPDWLCCCCRCCCVVFDSSFLLIMQSRRAFTTTTSTTRSASAATPAASTWRAPARSGRVASRTKSFATCTLPTWPWWSRRISCSSCAASNRNRSDVPSPGGRAAPRSSSRFRLRPVQVAYQSDPLSQRSSS